MSDDDIKEIILKTSKDDLLILIKEANLLGIYNLSDKIKSTFH